MGWSWSLHLCQRIASHQFEKIVGIPHMILDRHVGQPVGPSVPCCGAVYVDNVAILGSDRHEVDRKMQHVTSLFDRYVKH